LRSLVISSIPWSQSNRGIDILTEGLIDCGFEVDHLVFPIYRNNKNNISNSYHDGKLRQISALKTKVPYDESFMWFMHNKFFMDEITKFHLKSIKNIDFEQYDLVVIESGKPVMLTESISKNSKLIYRQSDPVWMMYRNKYLQELEFKTIKRSDLILTVREDFKRKIPEEFQEKTKTWVNGFSIPDEFLNSNPYRKTKKNGVYLGFSRIDYKTLELISKYNKDCDFHIIGTKPENFLTLLKLKKIQNLHFYGYMKPYDYIRYIKYADFGIVPYLKKWNPIRYIGLNSKYLLYMYFSLPIVSYKVGIQEEFKGLPVFFANSYEDFLEQVNSAKNMPKIHYNIDFSFLSRSGRKKELLEILKERFLI